MPEGSPAPDDLDRGIPVPRRGLPKIIAAALATVKIAEMYAEGFAARAAYFVANAPNSEQSPYARRRAHLGTLEHLVNEESAVVTDAGDSDGQGWPETGHTLYPSGLVWTQDMNQLYDDMGVRLPPRRSNGAQYFEHHSIALGGLDIRHIDARIDQYRTVMEAQPPSSRTHILHISAGGVDAIHFAQAHANGVGVNTFFEDFHTEFLPNLARDYYFMLRNAALLSRIPSMHGLRHIYVKGLPDMGTSQELGIFQWPGTRGVATAGCKYINAVIQAVAERVEQETGVNIHYVSTFTDSENRPIKVLKIHFDPAGLIAVGRNIEAKTWGTLPGGFEDTLFRACRQRGIIS